MSAPEVKGMKGAVPVAGNAHFSPPDTRRTNAGIRRTRFKLQNQRLAPTTETTRPTTLYVPLPAVLGGFNALPLGAGPPGFGSECSFLYPFWRFLYPVLISPATMALFVSVCILC
jgi:hypothetical protein